MTDDLLVVMCPPYPEFKEPPADHSKSELRECPHCKSKMWLSEKKKGLLMSAASLRKEIFLGCYPCVKKHISEEFNSETEFHALKI